jgi:hypothetical protein
VSNSAPPPPEHEALNPAIIKPVLRPLSEVASQELLWVQPDVWRFDYELRADETVVAYLRGNLGESAEHKWSFELIQFWRRRVIVRTEGGEGNLAVFKWRWLEGGTMELPKGRLLRFRLAKNAFWRWEWQERDGTPLVQFTIRPGFDMTEGLVRLKQHAAALAELPLLVVLAEYMLGLFSMYRRVPAEGIDG